MSVLRVKNAQGEWKNVPYISSGSGSASSKFGNIVAGENIDVKSIGDDVKISAIVPDISALATKEELATKQPKGDYAYVKDVPQLLSQLENDLQYQTFADVMGIIASIPQFKLEVVDSLPATGEKMTLYLVQKGEEYGDSYYEIIWIEQTQSYEMIGSTDVNLTGYVKDTDYATSSKGGVVKVASTNGIKIDSSGTIAINCATQSEINSKTNSYKPIVPSNFKAAVDTVFLPPMTFSEYMSLSAKDDNVYYMIAGS